VLIVPDPTVNPKLIELQDAFLSEGGEVYVGPDAWAHLEGLAGPTMARFLERYVHDPLQKLLAEVPTRRSASYTGRVEMSKQFTLEPTLQFELSGPAGRIVPQEHRAKQAEAERGATCLAVSARADPACSADSACRSSARRWRQGQWTRACLPYLPCLPCLPRLSLKYCT
jgi:hypothetical protein